MTASREETARARHVFFLGALADAVLFGGNMERTKLFPQK